MQDVPNARIRRNVDVVLLRRVLERKVKKNADSPKPAITKPVTDARTSSGNDLMVEFNELVRPPKLPDPVKK